MALSAVGDPVIGNGNFQMCLDNAPQSVPVALLFGLGPCTTGAPFACGQIYLPLSPPPISLPTMVTSSAGPCLGSVSFPVPVPLSASLCFAQFSAQAAFVCAGTPPGVGLTNAVCLSITES